MKLLKVHVEREFVRMGHGIWLIFENNERKLLVAKPVEFSFEPLEEGFLRPNPTLRFNDPADLRLIVDGITKLGIEPEKESFTKGQLEATKYHLEDLRTVLKLKK